MNSSEIKNVGFYISRRKKRIRYFRWAVKAAFLLLFLVPVAYLARGQQLGVSSFFSVKPTGQIAQFTSIESFFVVPITQSPCSTNLRYYGDITPGFWLMEPFGGLQVLVSGQVGHSFLVQTIIAILFFAGLTVLLGNMFCSWVCPVGTIIDGFDKSIEKFFPTLEAKRVQRWKRRRERKSEGSSLGCPVCPFHKVNGVLAHGILASAVVGSAVFKFPVFCAVCPIGIVSRGLVHFKSMMSITQIWMIWWLELLVVPIAATLLSLREKRYWCKRLCPVGAFLGMIGSLNPLIKPRVNDDKCIMKGCPIDCKDSSLDICMLCRCMDDKKCEKVCPVDIDLVNHGSLARCTKCLECYIVCDCDAISIDSFGKPDIIQSSKRFYNRIRRRS
ncbi:MAG: 4Fe-4S binding protein [Candidatus Bathyarchaeota archaeon]|nr:4Fe-4S binding protein [Candidatus Bathyarchaeota archaeon]